METIVNNDYDNQGKVESALETNPAPAMDEAKVATQVTEEKETSTDLVKKLLKEKNNQKKRIAELEEERRLVEQQKLIETENFKALYEQRDQELQNIKAQYEQQKNEMTNAAKRSAVKKELQKLGCQTQYVDRLLNLANMENVNFDSETRVVTGHTEVARMLSEEMKPLFGNANVGVNQSSPVGTPSNLSIEEWKKLPYDQRKKTYAQVMESMGVKIRK